MRNTQETNSVAHGSAESNMMLPQGEAAKKGIYVIGVTYMIHQKHLGELRDDETIEDLENAQKFAGGDFALELRGKQLHLFRVLIGERA